MEVIYWGSIARIGCARSNAQSRDVRRLETLEVLQVFVSQDWPEVLSIKCLIFGCGSLVIDSSVDHVRQVSARRRIAVENSRSLMEINGLRLRCRIVLS